jgi:serine/threonine protein kinase
MQDSSNFQISLSLPVSQIVVTQIWTLPGQEERGTAEKRLSGQISAIRWRANPMIGKTLAHYEIVVAVGAGGMGEVYLARDTRLGRSVAVKVLPEILAQDPERIARFQREAKVLASLNHPNIATLYGMEQFEGRHFLVMELVEGETLAERIAGGPMAVDETLKIVHQIVEALGRSD